MTSTNRVVANALMSLEELLKKQGLSRAEFDKMMKEMKDKGASAVHYMRGKDGRLLFKADGTTIGNAISEKAVNGEEVENTRTLPVSKQAWTECELKGIEAMKKYLASHKGVLPRTIKEVDDVLGIIPDIDVAEKQNVMSYFKYGRGKSLVANSMKDDVAKIAKMVGRSLTPNEERSARILLEAGEPASRIARSIQATATNAATNAKFKVGDKVQRGNQIGVVKDIEKEPYIEVKFKDEPITLFVHERELKISNSSATNAKFKVGDKVRIIGGGVETIESVHPKGRGTGFGPREIDYYATREGGGFITDEDISGVVSSSARNASVNDPWWVGDAETAVSGLMRGGFPRKSIEELYGKIGRYALSGGIPSLHRLAERLNDLKYEVEKEGKEGFDARQKAIGIIHEIMRVKTTGHNARACNSTNAIVRKALNSTALNFSPGDKVSIVDTDIRYGGDKGEVVRKDGFRYVVLLTSRQDKPEVLLQPNQLKAANSEDAQGHEHGSDGKFASKGGGSDGGDSYEDPKTKRMKERLAKMREKNEALRKEIDQRKAALAGKKEETEKMRADVMKANVEKWKAGLPKTTNSVVAKALNAVSRNAVAYTNPETSDKVVIKPFAGLWDVRVVPPYFHNLFTAKTKDEAVAWAKANGKTITKIENAVAKNDWEQTYEIMGLPVVLTYRGSPFNDIKATIKGGNRDWIEVARVVASSPVSQAEAEKMVAPKWSRIKRTAPNAVAKNAEDDWVERFEVGGVYHGPYMNKDWLAKVLSRTDSSIRVAIKSRRDKTWHGKDEQVTLRINKRQAEEDGTEVAKGYGWEFWANDFE